MSKLSELEESQIFIFETNYYTQKISNKTCNQTKESHCLSFTLTFPLALFFTPLLYTSLLFFPHSYSLLSTSSPTLSQGHPSALLLSKMPLDLSLSHILSFISIILGVPLSLILHATFLSFHLLLALSRLSSDPLACCIADFHQSSAPCISSPFWKFLKRTITHTISCHRVRVQW